MNSRFRIVDGQIECRCSDCSRYLPVTKEHFYFSNRPAFGGRLEREPLSYCKPCYRNRIKCCPSRILKRKGTTVETTSGIADSAASHFISRISPGRLPAELIGPCL